MKLSSGTPGLPCIFTEFVRRFLGVVEMLTVTLDVAAHLVYFHLFSFFSCIYLSQSRVLQRNLIILSTNNN